jgi:hypothetical protein
VKSSPSQTGDRGPAPLGKAAPWLGLVTLAALAAIISGQGCAAPERLRLSEAPGGLAQSISSFLDGDPSVLAGEGQSGDASLWTRLHERLLETRESGAQAPLAELPTSLPKRTSLAAQTIDLGSQGGKTQEIHPALPLPGSLTAPEGRIRRQPRYPASSPRSWRAPVRGARAPPRHLLPA